LQVMQVPSQVTLQQTFSAPQTPLAHSPIAPVQAAPGAFCFLHVVPSQ
jgi:hypothetical protein